MRRPTFIPRHARIVVSGFPMHAILRGIGRAAIFFSDADDQTFLDAVAGLAASEAVHVPAYAMMTNHVHLLMTSESERGASQLMNGIGQRDVQYINRTYRRSGTLFEGRYRLSAVEADRYLFACQRYIELNPVRAHRVPIPEAYRWSSFRCNALGEANAVVRPHQLYLALAETDDARRAAYRNLFAAGRMILQTWYLEIRKAKQIASSFSVFFRLHLPAARLSEEYRNVNSWFPPI